MKAKEYEVAVNLVKAGGIYHSNLKRYSLRYWVVRSTHRRQSRETAKHQVLNYREDLDDVVKNTLSFSLDEVPMQIDDDLPVDDPVRDVVLEKELSTVRHAAR